MKIINMNSGLVKKVITIFLIGLVCRVGFNMIYNLDMFKEFGSVVALVSYVTMICSSIVVYELPGVNFSSLNFKVVKQAIKEFCKEGFGVKQELGTDGGDTDTTKQNVQEKEGLKEYNLLHRKSSVEYKGKTSAGVTGLYGRSTTGRVSAGVAGLYGESSRPSVSRSDYVEDRYRDRLDENLRKKNIKKISANNSKVFERVSGFNGTAPVESRQVYSQNRQNVYTDMYNVKGYNDKHNVSKTFSGDGAIEFVLDERGGFKPVMVSTKNGIAVRKEMYQGSFSQYGSTVEGLNNRGSDITYSSNERSYSSSGGFYSSSEVLDRGWSSINASNSTFGRSSVSASPDVRRLQGLRKTYRDISNDMNVNYVKPSIKESSKSTSFWRR